MKTSSFLLSSLFAAALLLLPRAALAQSPTTNDWVDGTTGLWSTTLNWTNAPDGSGVYQTNIIQIYGGTSVPFFSTNDLSTTGEAANTYLIHQLQLFTTADGGVLAGNALRFTNDPDSGPLSAMLLQNGAGGIIISNAIDLGSGLILGGTGSGIVTNAGVISGGFGLTKNDSSKFVFTAANTFSGALTINAGVINLRNSSAVGSSSGVSVSAAGGALELEGGISIGSVALSLNGDGVTAGTGALRSISGANSYAGAILLNTASRINSDTSTDTLTLTGGVTGTGLALSVGGSGNTTINTTGINTSAAGSLTKDGTGRLTITTTDNYTGATLVSLGALNIQNAGAINTSSGVTVSSGGGLELQGSLATITTPLTLSGDGATAGTGALRNVIGNNNASGLVTLASNARINSDSGTLTLLGSPISVTNSTLTQNLAVGGAGNILISNSIGLGTGTLTKDGAGTVTINGHNTSSGSVTVNNGTLRGNVYSGLGAGVVSTVATNGFGTGAITLGGGTLSLNPVASVATNGLTGRYFTNNVGGAPTTNNYGSSPVVGTVDVRTYANLGFTNLDTVFPAPPTTNQYAIQFVGKLFITNGGLTQFSLATDDGHRMYIDGVLLTDRNNNGTATGSINLSAGLHDLRVDFGQGTGGNLAALSWQPVGASGFTGVPSSALFTSENGSNNVINLGNAVNLAAATSSTIDLQGSNFTAAGFNSLNPGVSANLTVSGLAGKTLVFSNTTFSGGTDTLNNTPNVVLGRLNDGGSAVTLTKLGSGRLILDQTAVANVMGGSSIFDIQAGTIVVNANVSTNGFNPLGQATVQLNGGNMIVDTKFGSINLTNAINVQQSATISAIANSVTTTLSGTNTLSGGSTLTLDAQQPGANGTATLTLAGPLGGNGNVVKIGAGALNLNGALSYNGTTVLNGGAVTTSGNSGAYSSGQLTLNAGTLTVTGNNGYSGATVVNGGTVSVNGANGRLSGTAGVTLNNGTTLTIGANTDTTYLDRVRDGVPININRGTINLNGPIVAGANRENIGADFIFGGGLNTITLTPAAGGQVELATDALTRQNQSTLLLRGTALGSNGNNTARFFVTNTPPTVIGGGGATDSTTLSIVPWIAGDSVAAGNGTNFVTYTAATGFRPLNTSTEYVLTPMSGVSGSGNYNTPTTGEYFTNGSATVNAVRITGGTLDLAGTNTTLAVNSGALMLTATATIQNGTVAFGGNEGVVHLSAGAAVTGTVNSKLTGTGGLTVSSSGTASTLTLGGNNSGLSGPVTINSSTVNIANDFNLGTAPGGATPGSLNLSSGTLNVTADMALNANRGIAILPGGGALSVAAGNTLTYGGIIAGANTNSFTKSGAGTVVLTGANTYLGPTAVTGGRLQVTGDTQLGTPPATPTAGFLTLSGGGTLVWGGASGTLNLNRGVALSGGGQFDVVSGSTLTYGGVIAGTGGLAKLGAGTLLLTNASVNTGAVTNSGGTLTIAGNGATMNNAASFTLQSNASLIIGSTADTVALDRISNSAAINLSGGSVTLNGASTATTTESIATLNSAAGMNTLTLVPGAGQQVVLSATNILTRAGSSTLLVRGDSLGQAPAANTSRVILGTSFASGSPTNFLFSGTNAGTFGQAPTAIVAGATTNAIINFMVGDTNGSAGTGNTFVTYDANGLRPLGTNELEAGAINNSVSGVGNNIGNTNFTVSANQALTGNRILNAVRITGGTLDIGAGNGLTNYSGAVLFTGTASITNGILVLPTVTNTASTNGIEGIISLHGATPFTAAIGSVIGGQSGFTNNQLTVSGNNPTSSLILAGANLFSNLVVNNIKLGFSNDNNFGIAPSAATNAGAGANITLTGGATLSNLASVTISTTRGMTLGNGGGAFETPTGTTLTYGGIIAGANGLAKNGAGTLALSGASTFTGTLTLNNGVTVASGANGALGAGTLVINPSASLQVLDDTARTFDRATTLNGNQTILVDRVTPGAGVLQRLGGLTAGNSLTGGQVITVNTGTNFLTSGSNPGLQFSGAINLTNTSGATTFVVNTNGTTAGTILFLSGVISGSGDIIKAGAGDLRIEATQLVANSFTGGLYVNAGRLFITTNSTGVSIGQSGSPLVIANGAQFDLNSVQLSGEQAVTLGGNAFMTGNNQLAGGQVVEGAIVNSGNTPASFGGAFILTNGTTIGVSQAAGTLTNRGGIVGNFGVRKVGAGTLVLAGTNTFAAGLTIDGGTNQLVGPGVLTAATGITINNNGALALGNGFETNTIDRIPDAAPIGLNRGTIAYSGASAAGGNVETLGAVTLGGGNNTFTLAPASGQQAGLTITSLARNSNSVLFARGNNLGTSGADASQIIIGSGATAVGGGGAAGTRNQSIVPWIVGATNGNELGGSANFYGPTFVTLGASGLRPLNPFTEMSLTVVNPNRTDINASFGASTENIVSNQTINALRIVGGTLDLQQNRTLTVTSGAIVASGAAGTIGNAINGAAPYSTLAFGGAEGVVQMNNVGLTINANITGSGGLTVGSVNNQALTLSGSNSFTGNVTVNGAQITIRTDGNLGNAANPLVLAGGTLNVNQDYTLSRTVALGAGGGTLAPAANTVLTLSTPISSIGTNTFSKAGAGAMVIQTGVANVINGPLNLAAGTLFIGAESQIGGAPGSTLFGGLTFNGGTLATTNTMALSANRQVNLNGAGIFDVASGTTLTENGSLTGGGALTKQGAGTLIIANVASNTGAININNGTLAVQGANAAFLAPGAITVASNATLSLGLTGDAVANPNRIADNQNITLNNGNVILNGSANASTTLERVATVTFGTGYNSLTLTPGGGEVDFVSTNVLTRTANSGATALVRGTSLGTNATTASRIFFSTTPTNFLVSGTNGGLGSTPALAISGVTTNAIIPWLVGDTSAAGNGNAFVTYGTNGLRPLASTEQEAGNINNATGAAGTTGTNFVNAGGALTGNRSINSLRVTGGTLDLVGANVLTNNSGAVLFNAAASITNGTLRLPTNVIITANATNSVLVEGIISLHGAAAFTAGIGSVIAGNTNVVVSGNNAANTLVLAGANTFTNLIVNNTRVSFTLDTNLGGGTITLAGGTLTNQAAASIPTGHNLVLGNGGGTLDVALANGLTIGSVISGAQNLTKNGTGLLTLTNANSFTGSLVLNGGTVRGTTVGGSLGNGNIVINGGNLDLINDTQIAYSRAVILNASTTNTVGNLAALVSTNTFTMGALNIGNQRLSVTNGGSSTSGTNNLTYGTVTVTNAGATFSVGSTAGILNQLNLGVVANQGYNATFETDSRGRIALTGNASGTGGLIFNGLGTNILSGDNSAMAGDVQVNNSATLILTNTANVLRLQNRVTLASGATLQVNTNVTLSEINGNGMITNSFSGATQTLTIQRDAPSGPTTIGGSIGDAGVTSLLALTKTGTGILTLTNNSTFAGALTVTGGNSIFTTTEGGELRIQGENARASGAASVTVQNGGTLTLGAAIDTVKVDRLRDAATLTMQTGNNFLNLNGANAAGVTREIVSNLTINTGMQTITLNPTAGNQVEFVYQTNFTRNNNATLLVRGTGLGQAAGTADSSRFYASAALGNTVGPTAAQLGGGGAAGSKTISLISFMIGDTNVAGAGNTFMTYTTNAGVSTNGYRPLTDAEYESVNNVGSAAKTIAPLFAPDTFALSNYSLGISGQTLAGSATPVINALRAGGGTVDIGAGRVLTIDSGAILLTNDTTITGGTLLFNREAVIHSMGGVAQANVINSVIAGTGGLTFSANNPGTSVTLGGNNTFVGTVNINGDPLIIGNAGALNSFTPNSVTINSGRLSLNGNSISINAIAMNGAAIIENGAAGNASIAINSGSFSGLLSDGSGGGTLGLIKNGTGNLDLFGNSSSANSLSGDIVLNSGTLRYGSDHSLGNSTLVINGGTIAAQSNNGRNLANPVRLGGNLNYGVNNTTTFQGPFDLGGAVRQLNTDAGNDIVVSGPISNGGFIKTGANTITLSGTNSFDGPLVIRAGQINLNNGPAGLGSTNGATFVLGGALDLNGQAGGFNETFFLASGPVANALRNTAGTNAVLNGPITLLAESIIATTNYTINGQVAGQGNLQINTGGTVTLTASNRLTGTLSINGISGNPGAVTVSGNSAALVNTTNIIVNSGNTLTFGATADTGVNLNRINDAARLTLNNAFLTLTHGTNSVEAIDTLALASGRNTITLTANGTAQLTLTNQSIARTQGATALIRAVGLGGAPGASTSRLTVLTANAPAQIGGGGAAGTQTQSIVPWAIGDNATGGLGTNFVTYNSAAGTGFRVLADSELFVTNGLAPNAGAAPVATTNFMTIIGFTNVAAAGNMTVNAIKIANASTITNGTGIGTNTTAPVLDFSGKDLTNVSGAFLFAQVNTNVGFTLTNGQVVSANEIIYHVVSAGAITITNAVTLSNSAGGFTFAPNRTDTTLILASTNHITGPITIDGGIVQLNASGAFGTNNGALINLGTINMNSFSLTNDGLSGSLKVDGTAATIINTNTALITTTLMLTNSGSAFYGGTIGTNIALVKTGAGTQTLAGANTFSNAIINNGTLVGVTNITALGNGAIVLAGGNVTLGRTNAGAFNNIVNVLSNGTITVDSLATRIGVTHTLGAVTVTNAASSTLTVAGASSTSGTLQLTIPSINLTSASTNFTLLVNNNGLGATTLANITSGVQLSTNTLTVDGTGNTTIAGNAAGITNDIAAVTTVQRFGLVKQGTGLLTLTGTNYFTNDIAVLGGTLRGQSNGAFGLSTNRTAIVLGGGTLALGNAAATAFRQNVTVSNDSTVIADRAVLGAGVTHSLSNMMFTNVAGNYTLTVRGTNANSGNMGVSFVTNILASGNNAIYNVANSGQGATTLLTLGGLAGPADSSVTKTGNGTLLINGSTAIAAFLGSITNNAGILQVGAAGALGNNVGGTVVASGATLDLNGINVTNEAITIGGAGVNGQGTLISGTGTGAAGNITLTNDTVFGGAGTLNVSNLALGFTLTKTGVGTLGIGGANTYSGALNIQQGTFQALSASAFGTSAGGVNVSRGAAVNLNGQVIGAGETITLVGSGTAGVGALLNTSGTAASFAGTLAQTGDTTYGVSGAGALTLTAPISGSGTVTKAGTGTGFLNLQASNTYTGDTSINGGALALGGALGSALNSTSFTVNSNAAFVLTNTVGANNTNRIACVTITLNSGTFGFVNGGGAADYSESFGRLNVASGANTLGTSNAASGQTAVLTMGALTRSNGATLNFASPGGTGIGGTTNRIAFTYDNAPLVNGILGGWATVNFADFATYANGSITNLTAYNSAIESTWASADNVAMFGPDLLTANRGINSLALRGGELNLNGFTLTNSSGGILVAYSASSGGILTNGSITAGPNSAGGYELISIVANLNTFTNAATIANNGANAVGLTLAGPGTNILAGNNTFTGGATVNAGTVNLANAGALNASGVNQLTVNGGTLDFAGNSVTIAGLNGNGLGILTNTVPGATAVTVTINNSGSNRYDGVIAGTNLALVKNGVGTQTLAGTSTYTGQTVINAGVVEVMANGALGATGNVTNNTTVASNGAAIHINGDGLTIAEIASLGGTGISGGGALRNLGGTNTWSGALTILTNGARINSDAGKLTLSGTINNGAFNLNLGGAGELVSTAIIGAGAGTVTKDGTGTLTLTAANTFTGGFIMNAGTLLLGQATSIGAAGGTVQLNGGTVSGNTNVAFTIANPIQLSGDMTLGQATGGTGALTFSGQVDLGSAVRTLTINNPSNIISGPILGTGGLTKEGTGALYLGGVNPFTGAVTINNGSIIMTTSGAFNSSSNLLTVGASGRLTMLGSDAYLGSLAGSAGGVIENTGTTNVTLNLNQTANTTYSGLLQDGGTGTLSLFKNGTGTLTLNGANTYSGLSIVTAGTIKLGNGGALSTNAVVVTSGGAVDLNGQTLANRFDGITGSGVGATGALLNSSAVPAIQNGDILQTGDTTYGGSGPLVLTGNLFGTGGLTKVGGNILALAGSNNLTSFVSVNGGTLLLVGTNALGGAGAGPVITIANGATLDLNGNAVSPGKNIAAISGSGVGGRGALVSSAAGVSAGTATNNMNVAMIGDTTIGGTGNYALGGIVSGTNTALIKVGTNTITLAGANTYSGTTYINEGTLLLRSGTGLGTTPAGTYIANGATLDITGQTVAEPIWGVGGAGFGGQGAIIASANTGNLQGNVFMTNDTVVGGAANLTFVGNISGAGSGLTKAGTGTTMLTATNTYTGATVVNAGALVISNLNGAVIATSGITINSNATLTLDNITTTNANRINDAATVTMNGGTLNFNSANTTAGPVNETNGALSFGKGANIITTTGSTNYTLTFASLARTAGSTFSLGGTGVAGGTTNQVIFTAAPVLDDGIIGGWAAGVNNSEFLKLSVSGGLTNLLAADYKTTGEATWTATDNVKVSSDPALTADRTVNSLNIQAAVGLPTINLGGFTLTIDTGGLLVSGGTGHVLTNGFLTAGLNASGAYELITIVSNGIFFTNAAQIVNNGANQVMLVHGGAGTTILRGTNTFTGGVTVNSGTLALTNIGNLGATNALVINGGTLALGGITVTNSSLNGVGGTITGPANSALIITNTDASSYGGIIAGSTVLTKRGTGSLALYGANTFSGALTVSNGTFIAGNAAAFGSTAGGTVIGDGATVDLNGQFISTGENLNSGGITGSGVGGLGAMVNNGTGAAAWRGQFQMGTNTTTVGGTAELRIEGSISGTNRLIKVGANTLVLGGTNTWTGGLQIDSGTVRLDRAGALTNSGVTAVTMNGGTLSLNGNSAVITNLNGAAGTINNNAVGTNATLTVSNSVAGTFSGSLADGAAGGVLNLTKTNTGTLVLAGPSTYSGATIINQGTLVASNATALGSAAGTVAIANGATLDLGGQTIVGKTITAISGAGVGGFGALVNNALAAASLSGDIVQSGDATLGGSGNATLSGVISGTGSLTKSGAGALTLSGNNTYNGSVLVAGGTLRMGSANALGTGANASVNGGTLDLNGFSSGKTITNAAGAGAGGNGAIVNNGGSPSTLSGNVTQTADTAYGGSGSLTISGNIGGSGAFNRVGAGSLTLSGANTFSGGISNAAGGTIELGNAGAFNASGVNALINNGTVRLNGNSVTVAGLAGVSTAGVIANNHATANAILTVNQAGGSSYAGTLVDGSTAKLGLTKTGVGALTLSGLNTYSGDTVISGGKIIVGNTAALGSTVAGTTITSGGTLDLNGLGVGLEGIIMTGAGVGGVGALINDSATPVTMSGSLLMSGDASFGGSGDITLSTPLGSMDCCALTKVGAGKLTMGTVNTYAGSTIINNGVISIAAESGLGATPGVLDASHLTLNGGTLQGTADLSLSANRGVNLLAGGGTFDVFGGSTTMTINSVIAGSGSLLKSGAGTLALAAANTFNGAATANNGTLRLDVIGALGSVSAINLTGGTLLLNAAGPGMVNAAAPVGMNGGTINANGKSENFGVLTLSGNSIIDMGTGASILSFLNSSGASWTGGQVLTIKNWSGNPDYANGGGTDQVKFGSSSGGLLGLQVSQIFFDNPAGEAPGIYGATILGNGEVVPVPEPATWIGLGALVSLLGFRERRRLKALVLRLAGAR